MRKHELYTDYHDHFEYFGNTEIERIRKQGEKTIRHDWIIFDSADDAMEYFNERCGVSMFGLFLVGLLKRGVIQASIEFYRNKNG